MKKLAFVLIILSGLSSSCKRYLDIVPDNVATLDNAFSLRGEAEKYLFTCYFYLPRESDYNGSPALLGGDEIWELPDINTTSIYRNLAQGNQNVLEPIGGEYWNRMYMGIRDCNIFLSNIGRVPDIQPYERQQWIAEAKFLKAYYHFILLRMYGPVPLVRANLPISAGPDEVKVFREPVDTCFNYIVQLLDEAKDDLPQVINDPQYFGKITKPVAYSLKAKILTYAASPLFNGNAEQATLKNADGRQLFNTAYDEKKWQRAAEACKEAIGVCEAAGIKLYEQPKNLLQYELSDTMQVQLGLRKAVTEKWNSEIIWANTQSWNSWFQNLASPDWDPSPQARVWMDNRYNAPLKIAEQFYTKNGLPISEDKTWDYQARYTTRTATTPYRLYLKTGYTTAALNFDREPRFYAYLGFDGGIWFGQGKFDDKKDGELFYLQTKLGDPLGKSSAFTGPVTGYSLKKLIHPENLRATTSYTIVQYPWPLMRLADLYLLYSECLNEAAGPSPLVFQYLNKVRARAGVPDVEKAWTEFSRTPSKITGKDGVRQIIHRERLNELAFEQNRFWDLRRWKEAVTEMNRAISGWNVYGSDVASYYRATTLFVPRFGLKDYFFPLSEYERNVNPNLVQNIGW
ncbi:RagB/SusD family nutrient uptake outer membrane protein [Niabella beijingensis]|uniref:RagB/SusD family nutrient uptake outer membrane protein n=1 Tax=Niabella beijingensis TaxID=2872700 RepID=UPI001CBEB373|nr:RagB/SusD family nutrient uptake outer membrane protein [Niabella beijingensis]MBZ4190524.1 RagB/SusD family nutrient uptake outer membrane protein [Niabella beijingensis]